MDSREANALLFSDYSFLLPLSNYRSKGKYNAVIIRENGLKDLSKTLKNTSNPPTTLYKCRYSKVKR